MNSVKIHSSKTVGGAARVIASIFTSGNKPDTNAMFQQLQDATKSNMYALASSFSVIDQGPQRTIVRGFLVPAHEAVPYHKGLAGFKSLSSTVYQDENDQMWSLKRTEDGEFLIRANVVDDPAEINMLMQACCSSPVVGSDNAYFSSLSSAEQNVRSVAPNDFVSYVQAGELRFGVVIASAQEDGEEALMIYNKQYDAVDCIDSEQVAHAATIGEVDVGVDLVIPTHLQNIEADLHDPMQATASQQQETVERLVSYWQQVWGYGPEYFAAFERIIRGHAFA